jgi:hypothetical protein
MSRRADVGYLDARFAVNDTVSVLAGVVQFALLLVVAIIVLIGAAAYGLLRLSLGAAGCVQHGRHELR